MSSSVCFFQATDSAHSSCAAGEEERQVIDPPTYLSFLVRLWREPASELPGQTADWQGEVEHIQTGERWEFGTLDGLLSFLRRQVTAPETGWQTDK